LFLSALNQPKQTFNKKDLYPDILTKAAVYLRSFALNHAFYNGNKRTALMTMLVFLEENGYKIIAAPNKLLRLAKIVVINKPSIERIKLKYLKKYCRRTITRKPRGSVFLQYAKQIIKWLE